MPRRSSAALVALPSVNGKPPRVKPPPGMASRATAIFNDIVTNMSAEHFGPADIPLLRQYAVACETAELAERELMTAGHVIDGRASAWLTVQEKAHRAQTALALRLRCCPQSRMSKHKDTSSARHRGQGGLDVLMGIDDDE